METGAAADQAKEDVESSLDASTDYWSKEANQILSAYRAESQKDVARKQSSMKESLNIIMELSFQLACHWTVFLFVPRVHPRIAQLDVRISKACGLVPGVLSPSAHQLVLTGFSAKTLVGSLFRWLPFSDMLRAAPNTELVAPTSVRGLELSFLATLAGIVPPYIIAAARRTLPSRTPLFLHALLQLACMPLACMAATGLCNLCAQAQASGSFATFTAVRALQQSVFMASTKSARSLCLKLGLQVDAVLQDEDESCWWEGQGIDLDDTPRDLLCPITTQLFVHPRLLYGMPYEAAALRRWVWHTHRHPTLQGLYCSIDDIKKAPELEALSHEFARSKGYTLNRS